MTINPAELGYFEKTPGSGVWYHPERGGHGYDPRRCESCDAEYMGLRDRRHGNPDGQRFCSVECRRLALVKDDPGYRTRHVRVHAARGKAAGHVCVDCSGPAQEWSQIAGTTGEAPEHYEPRCVKCHRAYDVKSYPNGEAHGNAKLTAGQVCEIYASTGISQRELARLYGVSASNVRAIQSGKAWKHVTCAPGGGAS